MGCPPLVGAPTERRAHREQLPPTDHSKGLTSPHSWNPGRPGPQRARPMETWVHLADTSLWSPGLRQPLRATVQGVGGQAEDSSIPMCIPGPGKGSPPKPEGAHRRETLLGTGSSSGQQAQLVWWEDGSFLSGFLSIGLNTLPLPGHWLHLPLYPAEEQEQGWGLEEAGGHSNGGTAQEGLRGRGSIPAPHMQTPWPPRGLACHTHPAPLLPASPEAGRLVLGPKGALDPVPLGSGLRHWREGPPS